MLDKFRETAITWDKASRKVYEPLRASAGDNKGRKLTVQIVNDGVVEDLTGASLSLFWETRDKTNKGLDAFTAVDAKKGEFEIFYTTGMLSNEGVLNANLVLVDTSGRVVSEPFTITVFKGIDDNAIQSSDSFTALTEALIDISDLEQNYAPRLNDLTAQLQQTDGRLDTILVDGTPTEGNTMLLDGAVAANGGNLGSVGTNIRKTQTGEAFLPGAIRPETVSFLSVGKNKFNKSKANPDAFLNYANGATSVLTGYYTLQKEFAIPVRAGGPVTLHNFRVYVLLDNNKQHLSGENTGANNAKKTITPTKDGYLLVCAHSSYLDTAMVEFSSAPTPFEPYQVAMGDLKFSPEQTNAIKILARSDLSAGYDVKVEKAGDTFLLTSQLADGKEITITTTSKNAGANGLFNWTNTAVNGEIVHGTPDDVTPIRTFATVGANHGYTSVIIIGMANHGKTTADLGSVWTDGATDYVLLRIVGNNLTFGCPYAINPMGWVEAAHVPPKADLTHVSGATNTGAISIAILGSSPQLYPSVNNVSVKYVLDGEEIIADGTYYGEKLEIREKYTIMDYKAIIDFVRSNIGVSFANDNIKGILRMSNTYVYTKRLSCTTHHTLHALDTVRLYRCGFLQSAPLSLAGHTVKRFMPNVKAKGGWDFSRVVDLGAYNVSLVFTHADSVDPAIPPNHYVDWLHDGSGNQKVGFTMGYIVDKTNSKNADRIANSQNTWDMRNSKKSYPVAVEEKTLAVGDYLEFQGFRNYLAPVDVGAAINATVVRDNRDTYLYADFNAPTALYYKELEGDFGKAITLLQGRNLTQKNSVVNADGVVMAATSSPANGIFKY